MRQIIKQPNGKYCIFSSVIDLITHYNMEEQDIINEWVEESKNEIEMNVKRIISELKEERKPYYNYTIDYNEMIKKIKETHSNKEAKNIRKVIES